MYRLLPLGLLLVLVGCQDAGSQSVPSVPKTVGLNVGNLAPALEGLTVEGTPHKLSDYRGKVVMVDFWATWCGPCRAMIPHEKAMVQRLEGRPFVLLGVSGDRNREALRDFEQKEQLPWPNLFDGPSGPLTRDWEIEYFPTIFVIDAQGVIRYRDLHGPQLEQAIVRLIEEAERQ